MKRLACLALVLGCGGPAKPATSPGSNHTVDRRALRPIQLERLQDEGGDVGPVPQGPLVKVAGDVISAFVCRPGDSQPAFVTDGRLLYMTSTEPPPVTPPPAMAGAPTEPVYCSFERFRIPHELAYAGTLDAR
jgi:hypothetical protein